MVWYILAALAAGLLIWLVLRGKKAAPPADDGEQSPVPVEGSTAFTGRHGGVKYWLYYEGGQARLEIETDCEMTAPFTAAHGPGKKERPGDERDFEVRELFRLGAVSVTADKIVAAQFEERILNVNAGTRYAPRPEETAAAKAVDLLKAIRDKSLKPA
ncbi:MAG: hypothetical protein PHV33_08490 [Elusimicrobiales bacterium]|nr:hypothetical protein [Elusimicrobiales bacterium]